MKLYFTNDSKQKKTLIESDYIDDIFDEMMAFFDANRTWPHFLNPIYNERMIEIRFGSSSEYFVVLDANENDLDDLKRLIGECNEFDVF